LDPILHSLQLILAGFAAITDWVVKYFAPSTPSPKTVTVGLHGVSVVTSTGKMPLVLQCSGHSVTIVGYEVLKSGAVKLLIFDPAW
jgi:signal recognition particle GTPase